MYHILCCGIVLTYWSILCMSYYTLLLYLLSIQSGQRSELDKDSKSININIDGSCFSVHHIYITYGAPACTTCLFILNLSKNSHLCFAIVSESGCKGKRFYRNRQMFSKVFFEKVFFRNFHKRRDVHPPQVLSVLAPLAPLR